MGGLVKKQLVAVIDSRTSMICLRAAGQVREIDEPFDTLTGPQMSPPFHLHCRSVVGVYVPGMGTRSRSDAQNEIDSRPPSKRREDRNPPPAPVQATPQPATKTKTTRRKRREAACL